MWYPEALITALKETGAKNLTCISNNAGGWLWLGAIAGNQTD